MSRLDQIRDREIVPAFVHIAEFALARGGKSIKDLPGCWEHQVDASWWMAVNGHKEPVACSKGQEVPPFAAYVEFNGWPAGILDAFGGSFAAGSLANEATFLEALAGAP